MNSSRISLRGSADTPGLFSTNDTDNISSGPGMGAQAPVGPGSQGEAMGPSMLDSPGNMNVPGPMYKVGKIDSQNELTRDKDGNVSDDSKTKDITVNSGQGGKRKGTSTSTTIRRIGKPGEEMASDARRKGIGRIGTQTQTKVGSSTKTTTKLAGTDGFRKDGSGYIKTASVNSIKPKGATTSNKPKAAVLTKKKKKDSMAPMKGYKH
mgnify:CR=1 FL=1